MEIAALLDLLRYAAAVEHDTAAALEHALSADARALLAAIEQVASLN
ncbi:MAG: hypothetical protein M9894_08580 [Planctomycetes bacterium]|nr:hypothetical protein [Planctomycetota bacterium]